MRTFALLLVAGAVATASATNLTPDNWDAETAGKTAFIKFQAPWWGHCKRMKPDWEKLMGEYADSKTILIGDVDCTAAGKPLCDANGVRGFPTIKHGDVNDLQDYQGGRTYDDLAKFAKTLKPSCSPANIDLCDAEGKAKIESIQGMSNDEIQKVINESDKKLKESEATFKSEVEKLQKTYEALQAAKEAAATEVKDSGVGLYKAVQAAKMAAADKDEL